MANVEYKVVPFIGKMKSGSNAQEVATQLQAAINQNSRDGWEFHSFNDVNIEVQPGCLAGLLGAKAAYVQFDQLVFKRGG
jgi:ABC-type polysaccharide/polyol phosphate transport system ATPase subunit